ncbi:condensation domain-containing protein [Actinomadura scrupuli]|uniref:condensation domain-containing protein n=1 Tax=Actinomadura scrupuli TaxID=559629 RepID=UPI003D96A61A
MIAEPYGLQRDMLMFATRDQRGDPRTQRYANVWEVLRVRGPLDVGRLLAAAEATAQDMDTLGGRFRHRDGADGFAFDPERRRISHAFLRLTGTDGDLAGSGAAETLRRAAHQLRDLQRDPPVHVLVAELGEQDHLLLLVMDHSVSDGRTLVLFLRRLARHYRRRSAERPFPGFWDFTRSIAEARPERTAAREFWSGALYRAADDRARPSFPGGRWKPKGTRDLTAVRLDEWPREESAGLDRLANAYRVRPHLLILSALSLVVSAWGDRFVPINYMRNGRGRREWTSVPGPLAEHAVTVPDPSESCDDDRGIADRLCSWAHENSSSPPHFGLSQRELETLSSEENRLVLFNFLPSIAPMSLDRGPEAGDGAVATPDPQVKDLIEAYDTTSRFGVRVQLLHDPRQRLQFAVHSDPEILPRPEALGRSVRRVLRWAVTEPALSPATAVKLVRQDWSRP